MKVHYLHKSRLGPGKLRCLIVYTECFSAGVPRNIIRKSARNRRKKCIKNFEILRKTPSTYRGNCCPEIDSTGVIYPTDCFLVLWPVKLFICWDSSKCEKLFWGFLKDRNIQKHCSTCTKNYLTSVTDWERCEDVEKTTTVGRIF